MNFAEMLPQLLSALFLVLALMAALAWLARRMRLPNMGQGRGGGLLVRSSQNIGQREKLVIIQFGDQEILLGVTATNIQTLASKPTDLAPTQEITPEVAA